ncbi:MAG TPA: 3'-5' exonuclease [Longimicrobiales bacterium]
MASESKRHEDVGPLADLKQKLSALFVIDTTDRSKGIQISLPAPAPAPDPRPAPRPAPHTPPSPATTTATAPGYVRIANGRVVRESRHPDSPYSEWAQAIGPAEAELERRAAQAAARTLEPPLPLDDLEYAIIDTETTGAGVGRGHRITDIAIVRVNARGRVLHEYSTLVNPGRRIPAMITALTHIDNGMVRHAPRFEDIARDVRALLEGRVFVAHNAAFDWAFVTGELIRTTGRPLHARRLCTVRLARKVVPEVRSRSLDSLSYFFDVPNAARHRAFGDARATAVVFGRMMERVREREVNTWQELEHMTLRRSQRRKRTAMPTSIPEI